MKMMRIYVMVWCILLCTLKEVIQVCDMKQKKNIAVMLNEADIRKAYLSKIYNMNVSSLKISYIII